MSLPEPRTPLKNADAWLWPAGYAVFTVLLFSEVVLGGWLFIGRDLLQYFFPLGSTIHEALLGRGSLLWDHGINGGLPLLARGTSTVLYPSTLLYLFMSPERAMAAAILLHFFLSASSTFYLATRYTAKTPAAWMAGLAYGFGGYSISMIGSWLYLFGAALLPLSLLALHRLLERPCAWRIMQFAMVIALQIFAMDAQTLYFEAVILVPALILMHVDGARARLTCAAAAAAAGVAALGLACCQWWPTIEFHSLSIRSMGVPLNFAQVWSLHPYRLAELVVPYIFGGYRPEITYWALSLISAGSKEISWAHCLHVGTPALIALTALTAPGANRRAVLGWAAATTFFLICSFGVHTPVHSFVRDVLPGAESFRYPEKFLVFVSLGLCMLGAMGLDRILADPEGRWRRIVVALGALFAACAALRLLFSPGEGAMFSWMKDMLARHGSHIEPARALGATADALTRELVVAGALLFLFATRRRMRPSLFAAGLVLVAAVDIFSAGVQLKFLGPPDFFKAPPALCEAFPAPSAGLRATVWRDKIHVYRAPQPRPNVAESDPPPYRMEEFDALIPNIGSAYCASYAYGYESAQLRQHSLLAIALGEQWKRFMDIFGVSFVIGKPGKFDEAVFPVIFRDEERNIVIHSNKGLPYAYSVSSVDSVPTVKAAARELTNPEYSFEASATFETAEPLPPGPPGQREVRLVRHENGRVRLATAFETPGYVVVLETFYPGWRAAIDGRDVPLYRANATFTGLAVPAGTHDITLQFDPPRQRQANLVSAGALSLCLLIVTAAAWRRRGGRPQDLRAMP